MSEWNPMLSHPKFKLGLMPSDPADTVLAIGWQNGVVPDVAPTADSFHDWDWDMHGNDRYGVCGPVSMSHHREMTTRLLGGTEDETTQEEVYDLYRRSGNPNFDPRTGRDDNGVVMSVLFQAALTGGLGGSKLLAYGALRDTSDRSVYAAIDRFGGVLFAVSLQSAQSAQTDQGLWDYRRSSPWGGHAILAGSYNQSTGRVDVATWAQRVGTTPAFRAYQLDEVWVPIWPELVTSGKLFRTGIDVAQLARDYTDLTGRPFPVTPPPPPPPVPGGGMVTLDLAERRVIMPKGWTSVVLP